MNYSDVLSLAGSMFGIVAGTSLILTALKASVIMGLGFLTVLALRNANAATRHMVWALTFGAVLVLPLASMVMPNWSILPGGSWAGALQPAVGAQVDAAPEVMQVVDPVELAVATSPDAVTAPAVAGPSPVVPRQGDTAAESTIAESAVESPGAESAVGSPAAESTIAESAVESPRAESAAGSPAAESTLAESAAARSTATDETETSSTAAAVTGAVAGAGQSSASVAGSDLAATGPGLMSSIGRSLGSGVAALILILWASGVAVRLGVLWLGVGRVSWLARRAEPLTDAKIQAEADAAAADLGLTRTPGILIGADAPVPMTWGVLTPRILLPSQAHSWSLPRLRRVLLHETAHIARRDLMAQWLSEIACALHWFNPLVWSAAARMRMEREHASDDLVLSRGVRASDYAEDLLEIVRGFEVPPVLAGAAGMARPSQLGERMRAVLDPSRPRGAVGGPVRAAAIMVGALVLMGAAALSPSLADAETAAGQAAAEAEGVSPQTAGSTPAAPSRSTGPSESADPAAGGSIGGAGTRSGTGFAGGVLDRIFGVDAGMEALRSAALAAALCPYPEDDEDHDPEYGVLTTENGGRMRGTMTNSSDDDGMVELAWTGRACTVRVSMPQETRFNSTETDIESMPRGGEFEAVFRSRELTRRLVVSSDLTRDYSIDGRAAAWDSEAQEWMADLVETIYRRTGHQAEERAARILRDGGFDALMREIALLHSDYVSANYIGIGYGLVGSDNERRQLLALAAETVDGDYRLAKVLTTAAEAGTMSDALRRDFIQTAGLLEGDYEMSRVFAALLEHQEVGRDGLFQILEEARDNLEGDYEMSRLYRRLLDDPDLDLELARMLVESAARNLDGDYEISQVLRAVAEREDLGPGVVREVMSALTLLDGDHAKSQILEDYAEVAESAADLNRVIQGMSVLDGDHARGQVLRVVMDSEHFGDATFDAVLGAVRVMDGYQTRETVTRMVRDYDLTDGQLISLIELAAEESGYDGSQILTQIARTGRIEGRIRDAYLAASEGFSDHEQDRILAALVRGGDREQ